MENIRSIQNKAYGNNETLDSLIEGLKTIVEWSEPPVNIPGYCASHEEVFKEVSEYVAKRFQIKPENMYNVVFNEHFSPLTLFDLLEQIHYGEKPGLKSLVVVRGIETFQIFNSHWYDQHMVEFIRRKLRNKPPIKPRKIIILSNIGYSNGDTTYNAYKEEARRISQFKSFFWEF